ncbi:MAG: hypothetical protein H6624_17530 [Bdellovibrionaceae bacterium]|nr:hypothetical protein [Bdellovibrionales bacterium]MCB9086146.1 hypothetical protein [Pseudobdellovibrionaceae bacterium]
MNKLAYVIRGGLVVAMAAFTLGALGSGGTQGTEGGNQAPGGGPNINQGAEQGSSSQNTGMMINLAAGATLSAICATPKGGWACPMAAMAFLQAALDAGAAGESDGVYAATEYNPNFPTTPGGELPGGGTLPGTVPGGGVGGGSGTSFANPRINEGLRNLENKGYKVNAAAGTITTPNGEMPLSAFSSPEAMAAAGYDEASVNAARAAIGKLNRDAVEQYGDKANVVAMGLDSRGGGGGALGAGGGEGVSFDGSDPMAAYLASLKNKMNKKRGPANVAGMQRMAGGEPIGVKMDNIFEMVHRRYQKKRKANIFIETDTQNKDRGNSKF